MSTYYKNNKYSWFWDYLIPFTKFWGIWTSIVLCGVGVDIFVRHRIIGFYIILATLVLFFLEIAWVITLFLKICVHDEYSKILICWGGILWIKEWKKTIVYIVFALALLINPQKLWLSFVAGIMLLILALLHFLHYWGDRRKGYKREPLLDNQDSYLDRFDVRDGDNTSEILKIENTDSFLKNEQSSTKSEN